MGWDGEIERVSSADKYPLLPPPSPPPSPPPLEKLHLASSIPQLSSPIARSARVGCLSDVRRSRCNMCLTHVKLLMHTAPHGEDLNVSCESCFLSWGLTLRPCPCSLDLLNEQLGFGPSASGTLRFLYTKLVSIPLPFRFLCSLKLCAVYCSENAVQRGLRPACDKAGGGVAASRGQARVWKVCHDVHHRRRDRVSLDSCRQRCDLWQDSCDLWRLLPLVCVGDADVCWDSG